MTSPPSAFKPNILVAPLDWGLGHATRCIPVVRELIKQGANILIAAEGPVGFLLRQEFPDQNFVPLKGYGVRYSRHRWTLPFALALQIPKILSAIQYENQRLKILVKEHQIHGIISDNRYGLYHPEVPAVFITHQLTIKTGWGSAADRTLRSLNYRFIHRFDECWVPDFEKSPGLAGELSHPPTVPNIPLHYIGPLSRFQSTQEQGENVLILLSGPEPQRTLLENLLLQQTQQLNQPVTLVRGLPGNTPSLPNQTHLTAYNHLDATMLEQEINRAALVVARCGYSTVMDMARMRKKTILIPTPGQTEQEYLSRHLMQSRYAFTVPQNKFNLKAALNLANNFQYEPWPETDSGLRAAITAFLDRVITSTSLT